MYGGGGVQGGRMYRNAQRSFNGGGSDYYMEPASPPDAYRGASTLKLSGEDSTGDFSPGLLDLHSFDTELLTEVVVVYSILLRVLYFCICIWSYIECIGS